MKRTAKLTIIFMLLITIYTPLLLSENVIQTDENQNSQILMGQTTTASDLKTETGVQTNEQKITNEGFERVPVKPFYGPLGIVLKAIEITLERLYILFEY